MRERVGCEGIERGGLLVRGVGGDACTSAFLPIHPSFTSLLSLGGLLPPSPAQLADGMQLTLSVASSCFISLCPAARMRCCEPSLISRVIPHW